MSSTKIDVLNREAYIDNIKRILERYKETKQGVCFAITGKWGVGKTFIIEKLVDELKTDNLVIEYNCWKYDYYADPMISILEIVAHAMARDNKLRMVTGAVKETITGFVKEVEHVTDTLCGLRFPTKIMDTVKEQLKSGEPDFQNIDDNRTINEVLQSIHNKLGKIVQEKNVIIFVDELDRCLPEYSIKVLERLHHLFHGIDGISIVISVDKYQLQNTVKNIFGQNTNTEDYLKKFIDFELKLDNGEIESNLEVLVEQYYSMFDLSSEDMEKLNTYIKHIFSGMDMRTRLKYISRAELIHRVYIQNERNDYDYLLLIFELFWIIMVQYYNIYDRIIMNQQIDYKNAFNNISLGHSGHKDKIHSGFAGFFSKLFSQIKIRYCSNMDTGKDTKIITSTTIESYLFGYWMSLCETNSKIYSIEKENCKLDLDIIKKYDEMVRIIR